MAETRGRKPRVTEADFIEEQEDKTQEPIEEIKEEIETAEEPEVEANPEEPAEEQEEQEEDESDEEAEDEEKSQDDPVQGSGQHPMTESAPATKVITPEREKVADEVDGDIPLEVRYPGATMRKGNQLFDSAGNYIVTVHDPRDDE